jgi:hypothetical protein
MSTGNNVIMYDSKMSRGTNREERPAEWGCVIVVQGMQLVFDHRKRNEMFVGGGWGINKGYSTGHCKIPMEPGHAPGFLVLLGCLRPLPLRLLRVSASQDRPLNGPPLLGRLRQI